MLLTEWKIEDAQKVWQQEAKEEGREEIAFAIARGVLDDKTISPKTGLPLERVRSLRKTG